MMDSHRNQSSQRPRAVLRVSQEGQPLRTVGARLRSEVQGEDPADHILIYGCPESHVDLIGNLRASPGRIFAFSSEPQHGSILQSGLSVLALFVALVRTGSDIFR